ncbi:MAG: hypothetical protein K9J17_11300 [Flavobacteriales bacterium]|nr:hypothetical protein [Flavobacteriales bacterium]
MTQTLIILSFILVATTTFGQVKFYSEHELETMVDVAYGSHCGMIGEEPDLRGSIERLIEYGNLDLVEEWLTDTLLEKRAYAAEAFVRLQKKGAVLTENQIVQVRNVLNSEEVIWTCNGCVYEPKTFKYALFRFRLE